ncbi:unnamed protein product [Arctia plantaginis]|uniref:PAP-associated domain-containing protein n=1 Tax=Arctia plantaginis TaxID=874455 RepID=A0A8S0YV78_ARCPL|nr:unnamed protein product [Arctia plantaginis]
MLVWIRWGVHGSPMCTLGDFDDQVQYLLVSEMLDPVEIQQIDLMIVKFQEKLRTRWDGANLLLYGSLMIGIGLKTSDVDLYLRIPNYNNTADAYVIYETAKLLHTEPSKYSNIQLKYNAVGPMITFYDHSTKRFIDVSCNGRVRMEKLRLIGYYLRLDKRHIQLTTIVKLWAKVNKLTGGTLYSYSVYLLVVFYLQQKKMAPSVYEMQASMPPGLLRKYNTDYEKLPFTVVNNETLYDLLGGFFKYYADFNYEEYCVSPHVGRPVAKIDFDSEKTAPKEFLLYEEYMETVAIQPMVNEVLCVQDVLSHRNILRKANAEFDSHFINIFKDAAKKYDEIPKEKFLRSIFKVDGDKDISKEGENVEVYETLKLIDCFDNV